MTLQVGDPAPDFQLLDATGQVVSLKDFQGQWVILYFYPRDNTPGCTDEACGFRDSYPEFQTHQAVVIGVSTDSPQSHTKFINKYQLPFHLLCDPEGQVATAYDSYGLKKFMGKEYIGVHRHTFLINPKGKLEKIYLKVKPKNHAAEVLTDLASLV